MTSFRGSGTTANASRYLQQLCKHWSHKFPVEFDPVHGRIDFDADTRLTLDASENGLAMKLEGADSTRVERLCGVVTEHLQRFAFREQLSVDWRPEPSVA